jgi:hypothetical protein
MFSSPSSQSCELPADAAEKAEGKHDTFGGISQGQSPRVGRPVDLGTAFSKEPGGKGGVGFEGAEAGGRASGENRWRGAHRCSPCSAGLGRCRRRCHATHEVKDDRAKQVEKNYKEHHLHALGKGPHAT